VYILHHCNKYLQCFDIKLFEPHKKRLPVIYRQPFWHIFLLDGLSQIFLSEIDNYRCSDTD
jgi:hypothetical protein